MSKRFYIYEGTEQQRDESDSFDKKSEAVKRAKLVISEAEFYHRDGYVAHVIDRITGEFVHTEYSK